MELSTKLSTKRQKSPSDNKTKHQKLLDNYEEMLTGLKQQGLKKVLLFISDGLTGMADTVKHQFPKADHQSCWVHLCRSVARLVREKDRKEILGALKIVYTQKTLTSLHNQLTRRE